MLQRATIFEYLTNRRLLSPNKTFLYNLLCKTKLDRSLLSACDPTSQRRNLSGPNCGSRYDLNHNWASRLCTLALLSELKGTHCDIRRSEGTMFSNRKMATASDSAANSGHKPDQVRNRETTSNSVTKTKPKFSKEELKARLSPIQYQVTQLKSTERPGTGEYNKFNKRGTYHCIVCDDELFKSDTKFESGCGWPAFFDTIDKSKLKFVKDFSLVGASNILLLAKKADLIRTEVLCNNCDAHLGHRFDDGPISKGGARYCINSAAMRFVPAPES